MKGKGRVVVPRTDVRLKAGMSAIRKHERTLRESVLKAQGRKVPKAKY